MPQAAECSLGVEKKRFLLISEFSAFSQIQETLFPKMTVLMMDCRSESKEIVSRYVPNQKT